MRVKNKPNINISVDEEDHLDGNVKKGQLIIVKWLLEIKLDTNIYMYNLAFGHACCHGHLNVAK